MIFLCKLTILSPRLPWLFRMAKAISSTVELANSVTSDSVNLFNFAMWAFASNCFSIELVPCSDGWLRTWWQTIHMMPGLPVSSIPQCKLNRHKGTCLELFHPIGRFERTFFEAHHASKMIRKVRSLKWRITIRSYLEVMIISSDEVFTDGVSDLGVELWKLGNLIRETAEYYDALQQIAGS